MPFEPAAPLPSMPVSAPPVTAGSLISRTFSTWWRNSLKFALFTILVFAPVVAAFLLLGAEPLFTVSDPTQLPDLSTLAPLLVVGVPLALLALLVNSCGVTYGSVQHLSERPVLLGTMLAVGFRHFGRLVLLGLVLLAAGIGVAVVFAVVSFVFGLLLGPILTGVLIVIAIVTLLVVVGTALTVTLPALLVEGLGPVEALRRSWDLTRGRRVSIFAAAFVVGIVSTLVDKVTSAFADTSTVLLVVSALVQFFVLPLTTVLPAVAYSDLRIEKEGVSTDDLAKVFE